MMINDNDFGVAGIVIGNATDCYTLAPAYVPRATLLDLVKTSDLNASDRGNNLLNIHYRSTACANR
ncbi:MAG: hypothetical protein AABZ84_04520 [Pseudomonadota bacterium]